MSRARVVVAATSLAIVSVACMDLFHPTDWKTLCDVDASAPDCPHAEGGAEDAGGVDAAKPPPDFCAWSTVEAEAQAKRACAWLGACEGPLGSSRFGECLSYAQLAYDCEANPSLRPKGAVAALWGCLSQVKACADVDACVFPAGKPTCTTIASGKFTQCGVEVSPGGPTNADIRIECSASSGTTPSGADPCLLGGRRCSNRDTSFADCVGEPADRCTKSVTPTCAGTTLVDCDGTNERGLDCAFYGGGACTKSAGTSMCAPSSDAKTCTVAGALGCSGGVASVCVDTSAGTRLLAIDCAKLGNPCDATHADPSVPWTACAAWSDAGAPSCTGDDACSGTTLTSCSNGVKKTYDCTAAGLGACRMVAGTGSAACTAP